jgi:HlyD family secretion protein
VRIKPIILVVLILVVIAGGGVALYFWNGGGAASTTEPRAQQKQAPSGSESPAATRTGPGGPNANNPRTAPTGAAPTVSAPAVPINATFIAKATGTLASAKQASLAFQAAGRIAEIKVNEGDRVKAGDLIASLDTSSLDAIVIQSQAALDSAAAALAKVKAGPTEDDLIIARTNLDRTKVALQQAQAAYDPISWRADAAMMTQAYTLQTASDAYQAALSQYYQTVNHPTDAEIKAAQSTFAQAQAALETAKLNATNARIRAPFDGTVILITPKVGESTTTGTAAVTLADLTRMQVVVNVDEPTGAAIKVGQTVNVTLDSLPGKRLTGRISKIALLASTAGNIVSTPVTVDIDPAGATVYPGLSATVEFQARGQ